MAGLLGIPGPEMRVGQDHGGEEVAASAAGAAYALCGLLSGGNRMSEVAKAVAELGGQFVDPLKTTVVQDQRCMTTWVVRRNQ